ncbi:MAG: extracellular solute-binding protein [Treponema sp.]|jgi:ABC-type glycerol-3-phosphate transport system substrate-binding protein|nr:extracellular solute-binding protein [Treponema sp.]
MKKATIILPVLLIAVTILPVFAGGSQSQGGSASSGPVKIEVFMAPWVPTPIEGSDPYKEFIDKLTGAAWNLTYASDFNSEITTRAVAGDMPDLILFDDTRLLFSTYDQGVLIDDWNPHKSSMSTAFQRMGETAITYFTVNGKLVCVSAEPGEQLWGWNIRKDWLEKLGLKTPATPDELFEVLRAFTFNDPDGNGRNDTYGITAAVGGSNTALNELRYLGLMYGPVEYYISNNTVTNDFIDGNYKKTLDFVKRLVDAQVIDPDWYTVTWGDRTANLYNGKYGLTWYPPEALISETDWSRKDGIVEKWWDYLPLPKGSPEGGKLAPLSPFGQIRTVSASAGRDSSKMAAIAKLLDTACPPNREYYMVRLGVDIDKFPMIEVAGRRYINDDAGTKAGARKGYNEGQNGGLWNWGKIITSYSLLGNGVIGQTPQPDAATVKALEMSQAIMAAPRNPDDRFLLNLNSDNVAQADTVYKEFTIRYILGQTSDYDGFVRQWRASGGQALLDEATQQLRGYGRIR